MHVNFALSEFGAADQSHATLICPFFGSYWISHGAESQRAVSSRFPSTDERRVGGVTLLERSRSATYRSKSHNTLTTPSTRPACCLLRMAMGRSCRKCGRLQAASKQNGDHRINRMITGESGICAENLRHQDRRSGDQLVLISQRYVKQDCNRPVHICATVYEAVSVTCDIIVRFSLDYRSAARLACRIGEASSKGYMRATNEEYDSCSRHGPRNTAREQERTPIRPASRFSTTCIAPSPSAYMLPHQPKGRRSDVVHPIA